MKIRTLLLAAAACAAMAIGPAKALDFQWDPKAPNLEDCLTRHSATYCNASVSPASIYSGAGHSSTPDCAAWEIWVSTNHGNSGYCICPDPLI